MYSELAAVLERHHTGCSYYTSRIQDFFLISLTMRDTMLFKTLFIHFLIAWKLLKIIWRI